MIAAAPVAGLRASALPESSPESLLLARACASVRREEIRGEVRTLAAAVDWQELLALGKRHRVGAALAYGLRRADAPVPADIAATLRTTEREAQHAELGAVAEVRRLVDTLEQGGVPVLLLKGVAISLAAFGRLGLRYNRDIDLLVDETQVQTAERLLEAAGYVRVEPGHGMLPAAERRWRASHKDTVFVHRERRTIVELHWRLFENRHLLPLPRDAWEGAATVAFPGFTARTLPRPFELAYLCVHGAQHAWSRLKWLLDIDGILLGMTLEEQRAALATARSLGVVRTMEQALLLREEVLGVSLDPALRAELHSDPTTRLLHRLGLRCLRDGGVAEIEEQRFATTAKNISHYAMRKGMRYWFSEAWFDLTNGAEERLPPALWWLAPVARPLLWVDAVRRRAGVA